MTAHQLAKQLLDLPDIPVAVDDGQDPSDLKEVDTVFVQTDSERCIYRTGDWKLYKAPFIEIH